MRVTINASSNDSPGGFFRLVDVGDVIFFIHVILFNSFHVNFDSPRHAKNGFGEDCDVGFGTVV